MEEMLNMIVVFLVALFVIDLALISICFAEEKICALIDRIRKRKKENENETTDL